MNLENLHCIDLDQPTLAGFRKFISAWLYKTDGLTFVVDPGPLSTIPHLVERLRRRGVEQIDYILLTHIHIDHAGGTGALLKEFPAARVICHPDGIRHMTAPEKLWQGSRKVLGKLAEAYGEILPVPAASIAFEEAIGESGLHAHLTPGHAPHHVCYQLGELLFGGEVAGVRCETAEGIYLRPATPPRFILQTALDSIDRMIALAPRHLVIAHYGLVEPALDYLRIGRQQLQLWVRGAARTTRAGKEGKEEAFFLWLVEHDEHYRRIDQLEPDIRQRERYFLGNTLRGMSEYVEHLPADQRQALLKD